MIVRGSWWLVGAALALVAGGATAGLPTIPAVHASGVLAPVPQFGAQATTADTCPAGYEDCGNGCINVDTDVHNCGHCGQVCRGSAGVCTGGYCEACPTSIPGSAQCSDGCQDLLTDSHNCGSCGNICSTGFSCVAGACSDRIFADGFDGS